MKQVNFGLQLTNIMIGLEIQHPKVALLIMLIVHIQGLRVRKGAILDSFICGQNNIHICIHYWPHLLI